MDDTTSTTGNATLEQLWTAMRRTGVRRPTDDRWLGGVCSGTARRLGVDPTLLRVALVALTLLGGVGVVAYALALVLLPDADGRIELERAAHGDLTGTTVGAVALVVVAIVVPGPWELLRGGRLVEGGDLVGALVVGTLLLIGLALLPRLAGTTVPAAPTTGTGPYGTVPSPQASAPYVPTAGVPVDAPVTAPVGAVPDGPADTAGPVSPPPPPPVPQWARTPARQGPGPALVAAGTGLALLAAGAAWLLTELGYLDGRPPVVAVSVALVVLGAEIVALGAVGRRDGGLGGTAFLVLLVALLLLLVPSWRSVQLAGDAEWRPVTVQAAERGGALGLGDAVLDLSDLGRVAAARDDGPVVVPVRVGVGELEVLVPQDLAVRVEGNVLVGTAVVGTAGSRDPGEEGGVGIERTLLREADPDVVVDARALVGTVRLVQLPEEGFAP
jgi:phage shock protein PspC (stress-responsive transcriptional regulator)